MKNNILIIGFGDLAERLESYLLQKDNSIFGLTRSPEKYKGSNLLYWDWNLGTEFELSVRNFDAVIFFPKPNEYNESGYKAGFIDPLELIEKSLKKIEYESFIGISSTRVYGSNQYGELSEVNTPEPSDFRGSIVLNYENLVKSKFGAKSLILRLTGLYDNQTNWIGNFVTNFDGQKRNLPNIVTNRLHRDTCAEIIAFALKHDLYLNDDLINCSEGPISYEDLFKEIHANKNFSDYFDCENKNARVVSNSKLKELGFQFK